MTLHIDHIVLAAPDLEAAKAEFEHATGVAPVDGGPHPGGGTRNALVSFGAGCYLEIIAPDPEQDLAGALRHSNGARFQRLAGAELLHWAVRTEDLPAISTNAQALGFAPGEIRAMARNTPAGEELRWRLMGIGSGSTGVVAGGLIPFFIDWQDTPHPSAAAPVVGELSLMQAGGPEPLLALLADIGGVRAAEEPGLIVEYQSKQGLKRWQAEKPAGFGF